MDKESWINLTIEEVKKHSFLTFMMNLSKDSTVAERVCESAKEALLGPTPIADEKEFSRHWSFMDEIRGRVDRALKRWPSDFPGATAGQQLEYSQLRHRLEALRASAMGIAFEAMMRYKFTFPPPKLWRPD